MRDWLQNLPAELTEADLAGMVEGSLPPEREAIAIAALKAEPRLGVLIKQLRADRHAAANAADRDQREVAPNRVRDGVFAAIDRRVLRELDDESRRASSNIPISTLVVREPSVWEDFLHGRGLRRLAIAASLLLVAGAGLYATLVLVPTLGVKTYTESPIAAGPANMPEEPDHRALSASDVEVVTDAPAVSPPPIEIPASTDTRQAVAAVGNTLDPGASTEGSSASSQEVVPPPVEVVTTPSPLHDQPTVAASSETASTEASEVASAETHADAPDMSLSSIESATTPTEPQIAGLPASAKALDNAEATRLAQEGRLAIVVRGAPPPLVEELTRLAGGARPGGALSMPEHVELASESSLEIPVAVLAVRSRLESEASMARRVKPSGATPPTVVSDGQRPANPRPLIDNSLSGRTGSAPSDGAPQLYWARVLPGEATLQALKSSIESFGGGVWVEYVSLPPGTDAPVSWDPEEILWWQGSVPTTGRKAYIPVFVGRE